MKNARRLLCVILAITLFGCSTDIPDENSTPILVGASPDAPGALKAVVEGAIGNGAAYALHCPDDWNGDLVLYAHGYAFPENEPQLPDADDPSFVELRDALLDMGYGVAFSSYRETGWSVKEGMNDTRQLRGLFTSEFGRPNATYLIGKSMGGLIAVALAERNHNLFDGALPICGVLGGTDMAVDYIYNVRLLFDYFYPDVLPGSAGDVPEDLHWSTAQGLAYQAIIANPLPAFELAGVTQVSIQYQSAEELINAILTAIIFHTASFVDFIDRTHGHDFFGNMDVWYTGSADDEALNAGLDRYESTRDADAYIERWYEPRGKLRVPVVTLHTTRDQVVQIFQEHDFAAKVEAAGYDDMLVQHEIDRYGHCTFELEEILTAFEELVAWSENLD